MASREHINEYFNGKPFMVLCALALTLTVFVACGLGLEPSTSNDKGIFFSLKGPLIEHQTLSAIVNLGCLLAAGGIMLAINKVFTFVRSMTHLFVSAFFLLQLANPAGLVAFNAGTLLCLVTTVAVLPLFASYQDRHSQRSIFLIFAMAAAGSMFHYGFLVLIPAFLLGFLNMGVLNLKGILAMFIGLVTPFWIVLGLGIAAPGDFTLPTFNGIWQLAKDPHMDILLLLAAITALLGIALAVMNLMTIMNYRMQTRVYNAFFVFTLVLTLIALCIDVSEVAVFLPLLNITVAVQIAHAHTLRATLHNRYILLLVFIAGCLGFCAANMTLS